MPQQAHADVGTSLPNAAPTQHPYSSLPQSTAPVRPPIVSIVSPDDIKKIRKMQLINFAATMLQLCCSLAIILIVRYNLYTVIISNIPWTPPTTVICLAATPTYPGTCEYAYSLASVSIFFGFILSLMQCLTMDCCGAGRAIEAGFDAAACAWWIAGGVTLAVRAKEANEIGLPEEAARNAVVAMSWISAALFLVLLVTNLVLIKRLGRAYKAAAQQMQQHLTAYPVTPGYAPGVPPGGGVQMAQQPTQWPPGAPGAPGGPYYAPPGHFPYAPPQAGQQQPWGPSGVNQPAGALAGPPQAWGSPQAQPPNWQQPPAGYPTQSPPTPPAATGS